jgi:hypothetical protein
MRNSEQRLLRIVHRGKFYRSRPCAVPQAHPPSLKALVSCNSALSARKIGPPLAHRRVIALGQFENEVMRPGKLRGGHNPLDRHAGIGERDIVADRAIEQHVFLQDDANLTPQPGNIHRGEIDAVDQHAPALGEIEPLDELGQRRLARPGRSDNADHLTGGNGDIHIVQNLRPVRTIAEGDVLEDDAASD